MHSPRTTYRRVRAVAALAAAGVAVGTLASPITVSAETAQTESPIVAEAATDALAALERWQESAVVTELDAFRAERRQAATAIAGDLDVNADALLAEWIGADERKQVAMLAALTQLGVPYRSMASKEGVGFDCSGLTSWAFRAAGVELPRISRDQIRAADEVDADMAEPGDLTYYPGHVSIYIGQGLMVHSPNSGNRVEVRPLPDRTNTFADAFTEELVVDEHSIDPTTTLPIPHVTDERPHLADDSVADVADVADGQSNRLVFDS